MSRWVAIALSAGSLGLVAAGCGGSSSSNSSGSSSSSTTPAPSSQSTQTTSSSGGAAAKGGKGKTVVVDMHNLQFSPKDITVKKGTTVQWKNTDPVAHDVTKNGGPGPQFASGTGNIQKGATYKQTLSTPGKISYVCTVHPGMAGTITVK